MKTTRLDNFDILVSEIDDEQTRNQIEAHLEEFELKVHIKVHRGREILQLKLDDITHFTSENKVVYAFKFGNKYRTDLTLNQLEDDYKLLIRINKQTVINMTCISFLKPDINGKCRITLNDDSTMFISRAYQKQTLKQIGEYYA